MGGGLAAEGEIRAVFLFDSLHFLVPIRLFSPVEEPADYRQTRHRHKDHHGDDACGTRHGYLPRVRTTGVNKMDEKLLSEAP